MKFLISFFLLALTSTGCDPDPAKSIKILPRPASESYKASASSIPTTGPNWRPRGCPPLPEIPGAGKRPSTIKVTGPCSFTQTNVVDCETQPDDFIMSVTRQGAHGANLMLFVNVENYNGPGHYTMAQIFVSVQDESDIFRWSSEKVTIDVAPDASHVTIPETTLDAEPLLVDCTGPMNNYQCGNRQSYAVMTPSKEVVEGTLWCAKKQKKE